MLHPSSDVAPVEDFFALVVSSCSDAIITKDLAGTITSWNRGAERVYGYSAPEVVGKPVSILFPPGREDEEPAILKRIRRGEYIEHYETVRRRKDGTLIDISLTVSPIKDSRGQIIGASKVARDITELKRERERSRVTLASIGDAVIATDIQGRVVFMNAPAERLTGWTAEDAAGQPLESVFVIVDEQHRRPVESPVAVAMREGRIVGLANHTVLIAKDRSEAAIDDSAAPIRDGRNNLVGVVLVFRDVSHRREAELAALRLAAIIEGSDDAIVSKNLNGIVTSWNPAAERIFGYPAEEMIGQSITKVIPPDRLNEEPQILARLQRGDRVDHFETIRRRKDGTLIHVSLTISPIRNKEGKVIGASKIARDITELKHTREKLEAHTNELEVKVRERTVRLQETVAELEAFAYSLSHDMRAPLRAIQSFTEIFIEEHGDQAAEGLPYLRKVIGAANRMDRLLRDVLNFARLSRSEIEIKPVDLDRLVRDTIRERIELQAAGVAIEVDHPLQAVMGHEASLTQCLANLLDNAVKFVAPGVPPKIRVFTQTHGDRVKINVRDNGIGIDPQGQKRLFALFERLNPAQAYQGTGIGLAIVRRATERMHGKVGVESAPGLGSTFWVELAKP